MDIFLFYSFLATTLINSFGSVETIKNSSNVIKWITCTVIILSNAKLCFFLRIFEGMGFIVRMLISVLRDLKSFLLFFFTVVLAFAELLSVTLREVPEESTSYDSYHGIGFVRYFAVALRNSIGDYDFETMI